MTADENFVPPTPEQELEHWTTIIGGSPHAVLPIVLDNIYALFNDVWHQFAYPRVVNGVTHLDAGGLSTLEDVRRWLDEHKHWDLEIKYPPEATAADRAQREAEERCERPANRLR